MTKLTITKTYSGYFVSHNLLAMKKNLDINISSRSLLILRCSIGVIYVWFGALKFFHGYSPAEDLAINTIQKLTGGLLPAQASLLTLAVWETLLGLLLILGLQMRKVLLFLLLHMCCTFSPLLFFPEISFKIVPYGFTLVGQYIMKNIIIISAAFVLWQAAQKDDVPEVYYSIE